MKNFRARLLNKLGLLKTINYKEKIEVSNKIVNIPIIHGLGFTNLFLSEPWMISMLEILLKSYHGTFIDVGINKGQTLIKVKSIRPDTSYVGLEPNPSCLYYIQELIKINHYMNCIILPIGVARVNAILELHLFSEDDTDSAASLIKDFRPWQTVFHKKFVPVFNFDALQSTIQINEKVDIIKIDVEGAELDVIIGMQDMIKKYIPIVLMEILPVYTVENTNRLERQEAIQKFFKQLNYIFFRIHHLNNGIYSGLELIDTIKIHSNMDWCEYLFVPDEKISLIKKMFNF